MSPPPSIQDLIAEVERDAPDATPLARLLTAAAMMRAVDDATDAALGYFVDQARRAGHSWAEIGESLGVSKQAAQQRQVARVSGGMMPITFERLTPRAREVLAAAEPLARELGHGAVGTEHLLLAQYSMPQGIAAQILVEAGLTEEEARGAVAKELTAGTAGAAGGSTGAADGPLAFTPKAQEACAASLSVALELGHNYIGTEHMLLGLVRTDATAARILRAAGLDEPAVSAQIAAKLAPFQAGKKP